MSEFSQKSFTLMELLIVIAVIAILAAIVLISLDNARQRAWEGRGLQFSQNVKSALGADIVGEWSFDSGSGTQVNVIDDSGNSNNGTWNDADPSPWYDKGKVRKSGQFFGNNYVNIPDVNNTLKLEKNITLQSWVYPSSNSVDWVRMLGKGNATYRNYGLWRDTDGDLLFQFYGPAGSCSCSNYLGPGDILNIPLQKWTHIVSTYDGANIDIYINGKLGKRCPCSSTPHNSNDPVTLGYGTFHTYFMGIIDEAQVYKRALIAEEVQQLYAKGKIRHFADK